MIIFCSPDECGKMIQSHLPPAFCSSPIAQTTQVLAHKAASVYAALIFGSSEPNFGSINGQQNFSLCDIKYVDSVSQNEISTKNAKLT